MPVAAARKSPGSIAGKEFKKYGGQSSRVQGKPAPLRAEMWSPTKSLLSAGDGDIIAQIYKERVLKRGYGSGAWGLGDGRYHVEGDPRRDQPRRHQGHAVGGAGLDALVPPPCSSWQMFFVGQPAAAPCKPMRTSRSIRMPAR